MSQISPEEKQQLMQARELIRRKEFDAAREILEDMFYSDTAQQWLAKLNQKMPSGGAQSSPAAPQKANSKASNQVLQNIKPPDPSWGRYTAKSAPFIGPIVFGMNWRKYGKPNYTWPTIIVGTAFPILLIVLLLGIGYVLIGDQMFDDSIESAIISGGLFMAIVFAGIFPIALSHIQMGAYNVWLSNFNPQAVLNYIAFQKTLWTEQSDKSAIPPYLHQPLD